MYRGRLRLDGATKTTDIPLHTFDKQVALERLKKIARERQQEAEGVITPKNIREGAQKTIAEHLADFVAERREGGRDERYLYELKNRVLKVAGDCGWEFARDISPDSFRAWRAEQKQSDKTLNEYLISFKALLNWMERRERLQANPLKIVEGWRTTRAIKPRYARRALTDNEASRLLAVAGRRRIVYLMAMLTGVRRGELRELLWGDVHLDCPQPRLVLRAGTTKNGKQAFIPLHLSLAVELKALRSARAGDSDRVFAGLLPKMETFKSDMDKAQILFVDERGLRADFHALRHTFCTNLHRANVSGRQAMQLMRHGTRKLTDMDYTDEEQLGTFEAVQKLAFIDGEKAAKPDSQLDSQTIVQSSPAVSRSVADFAVTQIAKSLENKGDCHGLSASVAKSQEESKWCAIQGLNL
ncbi:MAG TPA: tyrosine-type recombinase/integrase [Candidatus Baltobacteraceae bacterium]|nr:tyrosine-type recombinase/integrase [Candidatus Baltobacteraceae bacterium]